ncbi:MAG TPA: hypothetical protein VGH87_17400 [Polyangiaceae bacterium]
MPGLAVACSIVLLLQHKARLFPLIALAASALELLMAAGILHLNAGSVPITLILGVAIAVAGIAVYLKTSSKPVVSSATVLTLIGALQVASGLHLRLI